MIERVVEALDILRPLLTARGLPDSRLVRVARLLECVVDDWQEWGEDDIATLPFLANGDDPHAA
jgi:hypothetical protein